MSGYTYTGEFQRNIVRLLLHDEPFLLQFRGAINAQWFKDPEHRAIVSSILDVADSSHGSASLGSVLEVIPDYLEAGGDLDEAQDEARSISNDGLPKDAEYVRRKVIEFGATQRVEQVLLDAEDYMETGRLPEFVDKIRDAAYVESAANVDLYDHLDEFLERMKTNRARSENCTGTGLECVDRHLEGGGLAGGEMAVLCGLPGFGKTEMLVNVGANALRDGKKVFHALIGDSPNTRVSLRYDCNLTGWSLQDVRDDIKGAHAAMKKVYDETGGRDRLKVQWWPAKTITPQDLEDYLRWLYVRHAWKPDVLIVDYGAKMKPPRALSKDSGRRHEDAEIYEALNALSGKLMIPVYTAIQANRKDGMKVKVLTMDHFAEAIEPARDATLIITVNMTDDERNDGIMRLHCPKYRDMKSFWTETVMCDFATHTIKDPNFDPLAKVDVVPGLRSGETVNTATGVINPPPPPKPPS